MPLQRDPIINEDAPVPAPPNIPRLAYDADRNLRYSGSAPAGSATSEPVWQIFRLDYDDEGNFTGGLYAAGGAFTQVWDDREDLTYG
jgi:hypothetical protein